MNKRAQTGRGRGRIIATEKVEFSPVDAPVTPAAVRLDSKVVLQDPKPNLLTLGLAVLDSGILDNTCQSILDSLDPSQAGVTHSLLHNSILRKDFTIVNQLIGLSQGCVNTSCLCGVGHFHCAVESGNVRIVNLMISNKADVNAYGKTDMCDDAVSPLHIACATTSYDMAKALVESGADVNTRCFSDGSDPMHINACFNVHMEKSMGDGKSLVEVSQSIQTLLLSVKANIDAQNNDGQTSLHVVICHGVTTM